MNPKKYDVAVAYRVCPAQSSHPPPFFADDKYKLAAHCLESFRVSLAGVRAKLFVLLDGCPPEYETLFRSRWPEEDLEFHRYNGIGNAATFRQQVEILLRQQDVEMVCFAEDDYLWQPGAFGEAVRFMWTGLADFVTPYDHPDIHTTSLHRLPARPSILVRGRVWQPVVSTTLTFLTTRQTLAECRAEFLGGCGRRSADLALWLALTKRRLNPLLVLWWAPRHRHWAGSVALAWLFCWRQILFGRRYRLWACHPGIATHMVRELTCAGIEDDPEAMREHLWNHALSP